MTAIEFHYELTNLEQSLERFAYRLTSEKTEAQDLVQETYLKVLINQNKYENHSNFKAWTFTIMKNTFINNYRLKSRRSNFLDPDQSSNLINNIMSHGSYDPDVTYSAKEINQNIEKLNDTLRIPFQMHMNGYKYHEIAKELNLQLGTVKSRIFLSRKKLMVQLKD